MSNHANGHLLPIVHPDGQRVCRPRFQKTGKVIAMWSSQTPFGFARFNAIHPDSGFPNDTLQRQFDIVLAPIRRDSQGALIPSWPYIAKPLMQALHSGPLQVDWDV
ncbi:MAG: hypothetical protein QM813_07510 [Verrucomicrobiota bacterium]